MFDLIKPEVLEGLHHSSCKTMSCQVTCVNIFLLDFWPYWPFCMSCWSFLYLFHREGPRDHGPFWKCKNDFCTCFACRQECIGRFPFSKVRSTHVQVCVDKCLPFPKVNNLHHQIEKGKKVNKNQNTEIIQINEKDKNFQNHENLHSCKNEKKSPKSNYSNIVSS